MDDHFVIQYEHLVYLKYLINTRILEKQRNSLIEIVFFCLNECSILVNHLQ